MYIRFYVKQFIRHSCQILIKAEFSLKIFEIYLRVKFHENRSLVAALFHATERQTDTTKLIITSYDLANAPKNG